MPNQTPSSRLGTSGEEAAALYLQNQGFEILARNWSPTLRSKRPSHTRGALLGEIDIIARERQTIVFVEVKTRSHSTHTTAAQAVDARKQQKLRQLANLYIATSAPTYTSFRFDVISITVDANGSTLSHLADAFR